MEFEIKKDLIFPTFIWECKVNDIDNDVIKDYCFNLKENTQGATISNRGGWHSSELIFPFPHFEIYSKKQKVLVTGCDGMIAKYLCPICGRLRLRFRF